MRLTIIMAALALLAIAAAAVLLLRGNDIEQPPLSAPMEPFFTAQAFLAPSAPKTVPTTVRFRLWVRNDRLPVEAVSIDPDDQGPMPRRALDMSLLRSLGVENGGTAYYIDFAWEGPENTQSVINVECSGGNYTTAVYVTPSALESLPGA